MALPSSSTRGVCVTPRRGFRLESQGNAGPVSQIQDRSTSRRTIAIQQRLSRLVLLRSALATCQLPLQKLVGCLLRWRVQVASGGARSAPESPCKRRDDRNPEEPPQKMHAAHKPSAFVEHVHLHHSLPAVAAIDGARARSRVTQASWRTSLPDRWSWKRQPMPQPLTSSLGAAPCGPSSSASWIASYPSVAPSCADAP